MNDRFKFRVWDNSNEIWLEDEDLSIAPNGTLTVLGLDSDGETIFCEDEDCIIEQCTGLKDKNGNLIYDGDIIKSTSNSNVLRVYQEDSGLWRCVEYRVGGRKELPLYQLCDYGVEICGNIHENEELYND